ncbi:MAG: hypothetical protein A2Z83_04815 [Omnitrophica bacterium GWA2_52_8]|nr:MAG: hypothetical protein A2Z83_04815 [Omnitrophica bacterium GWA2_52_8]
MCKYIKIRFPALSLNRGTKPALTANLKSRLAFDLCFSAPRPPAEKGKKIFWNVNIQKMTV